MKKDVIVGLKELRENMETYISRVHKGDSFIVVRKSKPVFKMSLPDEDAEEFWDTIIDFTKIRKGGVPLEDIISRL